MRDAVAKHTRNRATPATSLEKGSHRPFPNRESLRCNAAGKWPYTKDRSGARVREAGALPGRRPVLLSRVTANSIERNECHQSAAFALGCLVHPKDSKKRVGKSFAENTTSRSGW